jgi:hypothetical protein
MKELEEVRFKLKLELSNRQQLKNLLKEMEIGEEYEKCAHLKQIQDMVERLIK